MSHEIVNNMIAWKGEKPWHGLGFEVAADATGAEMLTVAGLDWQVQRRALAMRGTDGISVLSDPLKDYRAITRSDNDTVFQIASDRYHPVQNSDIVELFREYCAAGNARMETVGGLKNGAIVWALARLNSSTDAVLKGGDELRGYVLFTTSHDGSVATIGKATQVRVVCWNTLSAALREGGAAFKLKHSSKWTDARKAEAQSALGIARETLQRTNEVAATLSRYTIDQHGRIEFLQNLLGAGSLLDAAVAETVQKENPSVMLDSILDKMSDTTIEEKMSKVGRSILDAMIQSPGSNLESARDTFWGAVNGVTYYADHERGRTQDNRLTSAWYGDADTLKRSAVSVAAEMCGIQIPAISAQPAYAV